MKNLLSTISIPTTSLFLSKQAPAGAGGQGFPLYLIIIAVVVIVILVAIRMGRKKQDRDAEKSEITGIKHAIFWICFIVATIVFVLLLSGEKVEEQTLVFIGIVMVVGLAVLRAKLYS